MTRAATAVLYALLVSFVADDLAAGDEPDYDIVYVRQPRYGDTKSTMWAEAFHPARLDPGADLMLLHPDGAEEVLVECEKSSVADPFVSFDGKWVYYSLFHNLSPRALNRQRKHLPYLGADVFRIHLGTREVQQLTFGEFTPNTGAGNWDESNPLNPPSGYNYLGYGILNLGPTPVPGGKVAFTSNRNGFLPNKSYTYPNLQLYVMDEDGSNVTAIAPMSLGSALHPTILRDGRIMYSTYEAQGMRDERLWGIWAIYPDGRNWSPIVSAFKFPLVWHFMTQMPNEDLVVVDYYNLNNNGFGALSRFPVKPPEGTPPFYSAFPARNPPIAHTLHHGKRSAYRMGFTPWGFQSLTPFTHSQDDAAPMGKGGRRVGKFIHPSAAPGDGLLVCWTPGPANDLRRPTPLPFYDAGIYLMPDGAPANGPEDLIEIKNDPRYNEAWPRAAVPYKAVHGVDEPVELPWLPNDGTEHPALPAGTPYGLVGSSSLYKRESFPGVGAVSYDGLDRFNTSQNNHTSNWVWQGADAGKYANSDIWAIRILAMEPTTHLSYGPNSTGGFGAHFYSHANERLRIMGEIPVRKFDAEGAPILDPEGNPDTSFLVRIPADTPFTFQTIDKNGMTLNMSQTWHQVRPGEMRVDCGGCHAHSSQPLDFDVTEAAKPSYNLFGLSRRTPLVTQGPNGDSRLVVAPAPVVDVEFYRDIRPILQERCVPCHTSQDPSPPGNLVLDDLRERKGVSVDYRRLALDPGAIWGHPPVISTGTWRQANRSRYVRAFQSRRSLLIWKIFGERLDGWTNSDHPTEAVPGVAATLPNGANPNDADLDFTGTIMPPPDSGIPPLTIEEKMTFVRWIDLGAPINSGEAYGVGELGWFLDDLKPTVTVSSPRPGYNAESVTSIRFGVADANSGVDMATLSVRADFPVNGLEPGAELKELARLIEDGVFVIPLGGSVPLRAEAHVFVEIADVQGNIKRVDVRFSTLSPEVVRRIEVK